MKQRRTRPRAGTNRTSLYQEITSKIIADLEAGRVPWVQPWGRAEGGATLGMPENAISKHRYSGINVLILWAAVIDHGFGSQRWLTFRQALSLGGHVRKGEHGTTIVYADRFIPNDEKRASVEEGSEPRVVHFLKRFTVFNVEQCDDLPAGIGAVIEPPAPGLILPQADALIKATGADIKIKGDTAFYAPRGDYIQVPPPQSYAEPINWHNTALHELAHWSGAAHRLNRDLSGVFGSARYAKEELIAEMASAFVCAALSIVPTVRHADYLGSWLEVLKDDDHAIFKAASLASKAADYLLAFQSGEQPESEAA